METLFVLKPVPQSLDLLGKGIEMVPCPINVGIQK